MKKIIIFATITLALVNCNNAFGMLIKHIAPKRPRIMQQQRILCTMPTANSSPEKQDRTLLADPYSRNRNTQLAPLLNIPGTPPNSCSLSVDKDHELLKALSIRNIVVKQLLDEQKKLSKDIAEKMSEQSSIIVHGLYGGSLNVDLFDQKENHLKDLFDKQLTLCIQIQQKAFSPYYLDRTEE